MKSVRKFLHDFSVAVSGNIEQPQLLRASRSMLLIGIVVYPLFGFAHLHTHPQAVDPLELRFGFAALTLLVYIFSHCSSWARTHINTLLIGLYYTLTSHLLLLLTWNHFSVDYVIGFFIILFCLGVILISRRALLYYCAFLLIGLLFAIT
ncbi:MAG: hypothetical protein AB7P69_28915, partial [Candidatus Binatia bacterium]